MKTILDKYNEFLKEGEGIFNHVRVEIREDENVGYGIVELKNGTPSSTYYNNEDRTWYRKSSN